MQTADVSRRCTTAPSTTSQGFTAYAVTRTRRSALHRPRPAVHRRTAGHRRQSLGHRRHLLADGRLAASVPADARSDRRRRPAVLRARSPAAQNIVDGDGDARGAALGLDLARHRRCFVRTRRRGAPRPATSTISSAPPAQARRCGPTPSTRRPATTISRSSTRTSASVTSATAPRSISRGPTTASPPIRSSIGASSITSASAPTTRFVGKRPVPASLPRGQFPNVTRNIVGIRLLAVLGADARPPRREVHP